MSLPEPSLPLFWTRVTKIAIFFLNVCVLGMLTKVLVRLFVPHVLKHHVRHGSDSSIWSVNSGFPSTRINLSPFTEDFRVGEQLNESID